MKRCPTCNRTYSDDTLLFCADDGTQLVSGGLDAGQTNRPPSDSQPTLIAPQQYPPSGQPHQKAPRKRKWLAVIALVLGLFALPFLLYSLSQEILWEYGFRNLRIERLFVSPWGVATVFATILVTLSVIVGLVAIIISMRRPAQYGGRLLALVGPTLSVFLMVLVVGAFAFRRMQGPKPFDFDVYTSNNNTNSNSNSNSNDISNRSSNDNLPSAANDNSNSSNSTSDAEMSETDKYRLFYAAAKSGDYDLQRRAAKKIGIVDENGMPTSTYQSFIKGTVKWAFDDSAWVRSIDTPEKGRAYALERL
jgi:hypothetical protein